MKNRKKRNVSILRNQIIENINIQFDNFKIYFLFIIGIFLFFVFGYTCGKNYSSKQNYSENVLSLDNFTTYSQYFEDLILYCVFYDVENGFYIDVGANDPNKISVTKAFYNIGWHGINIEPLPDKYNELNTYRPRDINLNFGVGEKQGNASLIVNGEGSKLSIFGGNKPNLDTINIQIFNMSEICKKYVPKNEIIQFCKIDVENSEKMVLLGFDFVNYRPKVFCIESVRPGPQIPNFKEWEYILLENDYSFVYAYSINRFYIDNRISGLKQRFLSADGSINYLKAYWRRRK